MKKWIAIMAALICMAEAAVSAFAETGFESLYALYSDEQIFSTPIKVSVMDEEEMENECFTVFLLDPDNDLVLTVLAGTDGSGEKKFCEWHSNFEVGALMMSFLIDQFESLQAICDEGIGFTIGISFDSGENMTYISTAEEAKALAAILHQGAGETETAENTETP